MTVPVRPQLGCCVVDVEAAKAIEADAPVHLFEGRGKGRGVGDVDAGDPEVAGVEAEPELRVMIEAVEQCCELVDRAADRGSGAGRVLEQDPGPVVACVERRLECGSGLLEPGVQAGAEMGADVEDDSVGFDGAGDLDGLQERRTRLLPDLAVRGGEIDEVHGVTDNRSDPCLGARLFEALDVFRRVARRAPGPWALREDLDGVGAAFHGALDGRVDPPGCGHMGAGQHGTTLSGVVERAQGWHTNRQQGVGLRIARISTTYGTSGSSPPMTETIGVIGAGWVGLVTAGCFADLGHDVTVCDVDSSRIAELESGRVPIHEPGVAELLDRNRDRLRFTTSAADVLRGDRLVFVCVGTPAVDSGDADLSAVWRVIDELPDTGSVIVLVMKSTVPPGTGEKVRTELDARGLEHVGYVSNPEFFAEGTAIADFRAPDRIVVGSFRDDDGDRVAKLHERVGAPVVRADVTSAEMIKYASNAFLATKISFINEIANVCEEVGADVTVVADGMGRDRRIGPQFLKAGIGYGGSCFPKDVSALKQLAGNSGYHFQLLTSVIEVNELQKRRVIGKLQSHLGRLRGRTVALLGLAFKPDTNDVREASSLVLALRLLAEGAHVKAWDPVAVEDAEPHLPGVQLHEELLEAVSGADAAVLVTEWTELTSLARAEVRSAMRFPLIVDGRNFLDPEAVRKAGFVYEGIGRLTGPRPLELLEALASSQASMPVR